MAGRGLEFRGGRRIWAEYTPARETSPGYYVPGDVVEIAVEEGPYVGARVVSRALYEHEMDVWREATLAGHEVLSREEFLAIAHEDYVDAYGAALAEEAFRLAPTTNTVVLQPEEQRTSGRLIRAELQLDPTSGYAPRAEVSAAGPRGTVLLGETGRPLYDSEGSIGYKMGYAAYPEGADADDYCKNPPRTEYTANGETFQSYDDVYQFAYCVPDRKVNGGLPLPLLAPFIGAEVDCGARWDEGKLIQSADGSVWRLAAAGIPTNNQGYFELDYSYPRNTEFPDTLYVTINYATEDPRTPFGGSYYYHKRIFSGATFEVNDGAINALANMAANPLTRDQVITASRDYVYTTTPGIYGPLIDTHEWRDVNVPIQVSYLSVPAAMVNPLDEEVAPADGMALIRMDDEEGVTTYGYTAPASAGVAPTVQEIEGTGVHRVTDAPLDRNHQGLLRDISRPDISDTDLFLYGLDGQLLFERRGLRQNETHGVVCDGPNGTNCHLPGDQEYDAEFNLLSVIPDRRQGDRLKLVAVNRASGYLGVAEVSLPGEEMPAGSADATRNIYGIYAGESVGQPSDGTGGGTGTGGQFAGDEGDSLDGTLLLRPPNLRVTARRVREGEDLADGVDRAQVISFEGAGLTSDQQIVLTTDWYAWDGSALPSEVPGYTGRLAYVSDEAGHLETTSSSDAALQGDGHDALLRHFAIRPGHNTVILFLPEEGVNNAHFYLQINGHPLHSLPSFDTDAGAREGADFESTGTAGEGPLLQRPNHFVPFMVPLFDEEATLAAAQTQLGLLREAWLQNQNPAAPLPRLEDLSRQYTWRYRPEYQFSLYDLEVNEIELRTALTEGQSGGTWSTSVAVDYDLSTQLGTEPLERLGADPAMVVSLGYDELLAVVDGDEEASAAFPELESLLTLSPAAQASTVESLVGQLEPEDYLSLQIYQNNDAGNALFVQSGLPLVLAEPRALSLQRSYMQARFAAADGLPAVGPDHVDSYEVLTFRLPDAAIVSAEIRAAGSSGASTTGAASLPLGVIAAPQQLAPLDWALVIDYQSLLDAGLSRTASAPMNLELVVRPVSPDGGDDETALTHRVVYPLRMSETHPGKTLGELVVHDVAIQTGMLRLSRQDFALSGVGPQLAFVRSYANVGGDVTGLMGPGWSHGNDMELVPLADTSFASLTDAVPHWVEEAVRTGGGYSNSRFRRPELLGASEPTEYTMVQANGTVFLRHGSGWLGQVGRHATLLEEPCVGEAAAAGGPCLVYRAKDGTKYYYPRPEPRPIEPAPRAHSGGPTVLTGDTMVTRLGVPGEAGAPSLPGILPSDLVLDTAGSATGGATGSGGASSSGGATGSGGATSAGGSMASGGASSSGGASAGGGSTSTGGGSGTGLEDGESRMPARSWGVAGPTPISAIVDRFGNTMSFGHDGLGRLETQTDSTGRSCRFYYGDDDATEQCGAPAYAHQYHRLRRVTCLPESAGAYGDAELTVAFCYDAEGYLERAVRPLDHYDADVWSSEPEDRVERYGYAEENGTPGAERNLVTTTWVGAGLPGSEASRTTTYHYREGTEPFDLGLGDADSGLSVYRPYEVVERVSYPATTVDGGAQGAAEVRIQYSGLDRVVDGMRGSAYQTTYTLNALGNPRTITEPRGKVTTLTWGWDMPVPERDNLLRIKSVTNGAAGTLTTNYEYDEQGNLTREQGPGAFWVERTWEPSFSLVLTEDDWRGVHQEWHYDTSAEGRGVLLSHEDGAGGVFIYHHEPNGLRHDEHPSDAPARTVTYSYDSHGNPSQISQPGRSTQFEYDARGRLRRMVDGAGRVTTFYPNDLDQVERIVHPTLAAEARDAEAGQRLNPEEELRYDAVGNLRRRVDRNGLGWSYTYSPRNHLLTVSNDEQPGASRRFEYDLDGRVVREYDWEDRASRFSYDELGFPRQKWNRLGDSMRLVHDLVGNVTAVVDYSGLKTDREVDALGRLLREAIDPSTCSGCGALERSTQYFPTPRNDGDRSVYHTQVTDESGVTTYYDYDARGLLVARENEAGSVYRWYYDSSGNLTRTVDEDTYCVDYSYNARNERVSVQHMGRGCTTPGPQTTYDYDGAGNRNLVLIEADVGSEGNQTLETRIAYDAWNRPNVVRDPEGYPTRTVYDGEGNVVSIENGAGNTRRWIRNARGMVVGFVNASHDGQCTPVGGLVSTTATECVSYFPNGWTETITNARGAITQREYDDEGRVDTTIEALGTANERSTEVSERDAMGKPLRVVDYLGTPTEFEYYGHHLLRRVTDGLGRHEDYTYTPSGKLATVTGRRAGTEPGSFVTTYSYDPTLERLRRIENAEHEVSELFYYPSGRVKQQLDARAGETYYEYDAFERLAAVYRYQGTRGTERTSPPAGALQVAEYEYDRANQLRRTWDAKRNQSEYQYNRRGQVAAVLSPEISGDRATEHRYYDGAGNLNRIVHPACSGEVARETTLGYDAENRPLWQALAGERTDIDYDAAGNVEYVTAPDGQSTGSHPGVFTHYEYDALNRLTRVTDPVGIATGYEYDDADNLRHTYGPVDPGLPSRVPHVEYQYDALSRLTAQIQHGDGTAATLTTQYTEYDAEGNLRTWQDANEQEFEYDYDEVGRLTAAHYPPSPDAAWELEDVNYAYYPGGALQRVDEHKQGPGGALTDTTAYVVDPVFNRLDQQTERGLVTSFTYDANGSRQSVTRGERTTTYAYDARNRLSTATLDGGGVVQHGYYEDGRLASITRPNSTSTTYTYHPNYRVDTITHSRGTEPFAQYEYGYDPNGNRTSQTELLNGATETTNYGYDSAGRLTDYQVIRNGTGVLAANYTYQGYNRHTETLTEGGVETKVNTYAYDIHDRLTQVVNVAPGQSGTVSYTYDGNGNTLSRTDTQDAGVSTFYEYDASNQLVRATRGLPGETEPRQLLGSYDYNYAGQRVRHYGSERGDVETFYDGSAALEERVPDGTLLAHYRYGATALAMEAPGQGTQWYHQDGLGSNVALTDATGAQAATYRLDPWGGVREKTGETFNNQVFTGHEHDEQTGLIYANARYYKPEEGRFLTQDSYPGSTMEPPSLNRYLYAYSNPGRYVDPSGHTPEDGFVDDPKAPGTMTRPMPDGSAQVRTPETEEWEFSQESGGTWNPNQVDSAEAFNAESRRIEAGLSSGNAGKAGTPPAVAPKPADKPKVAVTQEKREAKETNVAPPLTLAEIEGEPAPLTLPSVPRTGGDADELPRTMRELIEERYGKPKAPLSNEDSVDANGTAKKSWSDQKVEAMFAAVQNGVLDLIPGAIEGIGQMAGISASVAKYVPPLWAGYAVGRGIEWGANQIAGGIRSSTDAWEAEIPTDALLRQVYDEQSFGFGVFATAASMVAGPAVGKAVGSAATKVSGQVGRLGLGRRLGGLFNGMGERVASLFRGRPGMGVCTCCFTQATAVATLAGTMAISQVALGQRVQPDHEECHQSYAEEQVVVEFDRTEYDEHAGTIELLRPVSWLQQHGAALGAELYLTLTESEFSGWARVTAIKAAPSVEDGEGCVVTGIFRHEVSDLVTVRLFGGEELEVTPKHLLFSEERGWVTAGALEDGEVLRTGDSTAVVETVDHGGLGLQPVVNLEVSGGHQYLVGDAEVLAHNVCPCPVGAPRRPGGYQRYDVDEHGALSPGANRAPGHGNVSEDDLVQSHHPIQDRWATENVPGYDRDAAPAVLLPSRTGMSHARISSAQRLRRQAAGANRWSSTTLKDEFQIGYEEMVSAGVPEPVARQAMRRAYKYFDALGAFR